MMDTAGKGNTYASEYLWVILNLFSELSKGTGGLLFPVGHQYFLAIDEVKSQDPEQVVMIETSQSTLDITVGNHDKVKP